MHGLLAQTAAETQSTLLSLGVGGIFALLIIDKVFNFVRAKKPDPVAKDVMTVRKMVVDLWDWHNVNDSDGVKVWYVRRSLEKAVEKLSESIDHQTTVLLDIHREQIEMREQMRNLSKDMPRSPNIWPTESAS